jgi:hypothetical protein
VEQPFVTLIADRLANDPHLDADLRYSLLHIAFKEESYDATCIAIQHVVDALPGMFAGDEVRVQFVHARPEYSATWEGVMPSRYEVEDRAFDREGPVQGWRDFVGEVYAGTKP